jgi:hypothetical protein
MALGLGFDLISQELLQKGTIIYGKTYKTILHYNLATCLMFKNNYEKFYAYCKI